MKKNIIEINLEKIENNNIVNFIQTEFDHCKKHKIKINIFKDLNLIECNGHFTDEPCLTVNINDNIEQWLPIFIHETCHKDQYIEKSECWVTKIGNEYDPLEILDMWIDKHVELKKHQLRAVLDPIIQVELDCEKRTVEKIKKFNLPIDIEQYIQKANAYVWYYRAAVQFRAYTQRTSPDLNSEVWTKMPVDFNNDYSKIKNKMLKLYKKHCY